MVTRTITHQSSENIPKLAFTNVLTTMNNKVVRTGLYNKELIEVKMSTEYWTSTLESTNRTSGSTSLPEFESAVIGQCEDSGTYPIDPLEALTPSYKGKQMYTISGLLC